jgi:hypothetical protein
MGMLGVMVQIAVLPMFHTGHDLPLRRAITCQRIRQHDARDIRESLEQYAEERLRGRLIPAPLYEAIEDGAVLVHGPPQRIAWPTDGEQDFIHRPCVAGPGTRTAPLIGIGLAEFPAPISHRLRGQDDAACGHQLLDIPIAQANANVPQDTMPDDLVV